MTAIEIFRHTFQDEEVFSKMLDGRRTLYFERRFIKSFIAQHNGLLKRRFVNLLYGSSPQTSADGANSPQKALLFKNLKDCYFSYGIDVGFDSSNLFIEDFSLCAIGFHLNKDFSLR